MAPLVSRPSWNVDLLSGRIEVDGSSPRLSPLERSLLVFIALHPVGSTREEIAMALYERNDDVAGAGIKVLVYRIRQRIGKAECIRFEHGRYALDHDPMLELRAVERDVLPGSSTRGVLDERTRGRLQVYRSRLHSQRPAVLLDQPWFERVERQLRQLERSISLRLATDMFGRRDFASALDLAADLIALDPLDEEACEVAMRVYLAGGERGAALAEYRRYRDVLQRELGTAPPDSLRDLLAT